MAATTTIIYLTDNELDPRVADACRFHLLRAAARSRIVSVSQRPIDLGDNVCVGDIGRSGLSIDRQLKAGLDVIDTEFVSIAEHDCIYSAEHFAWTPPDGAIFYYNTNCWLLQYHSDAHPEYDGIFSLYKDRFVQSQLVCGADALRRAVDEKLAILSDPSVIEKWPGRTRLGEPGTNYLHRSRRIFRDRALLPIWHRVKDYITKYNAKAFRTAIPNIDIRHGNNFTGARRGNRRRWALAPWGSLEDILGARDPWR